MDEPILPHRGRPLLLKKDANFTQLVVDRVSGLDGTIYEVLFIGTGTLPGGRGGRRGAVGTPLTLLPRPAGDGWVHKALNLGAHVHLVEELQVFEPAQPVESLVLAGRKVSGAAGRGWGPRRRVVSPHRHLPACPCPRRSCSSPARASRWPSCRWPTAAATSPAPTASLPGTRTAPGAATPASASAPRASTGKGVPAGLPVALRGPPLTSAAVSSRRSQLVQDVLSSDTRACTLPQVAKQGETLRRVEPGHWGRVTGAAGHVAREVTPQGHPRCCAPPS